MIKITVFLVAFTAVQASAGLLPWITPSRPVERVKISELPIIRDQAPHILSTPLPSEIRLPIPQVPVKKPAEANTVIHLPSPYLPNEIAPGKWKFPGEEQPSKPRPQAWLQARRVWDAAYAESAGRLSQVFDNAGTSKDVVVPEPVPAEKPAADKKQINDISKPRPEEKSYTFPELDLERGIGIR